MTPREEFAVKCVTEFMRAADAGELTDEDVVRVRRFREAMEALRTEGLADG